MKRKKGGAIKIIEEILKASRSDLKNTINN